MTFAEKITTLRRQRGLSQEQLADQLGVSRQAVSKWESESALPELPKLIAMADLFGVTLDWLVRDGETAPPQDAVRQLEERVEALDRRTDSSLYAYTSRRKLFGLPLLSIRFSKDRGPTKNSTALGIVAIGNFAVGLFSVGLISAGVLSVGMVSLGLLALGCVSIGTLAIGISCLGVFSIGISAVGVKTALGVATDTLFKK